MAPRLAVARKAMTASAAFGTYPATRSPGPTPRSRSIAARPPTCSRSIPHVRWRLTGPCSGLRGFPGVDQRDPLRVAPAEQVLDVADLRAGKPLNIRHDRPGQHPLVRGGRTDVEVVPDGRPELLQPLRRPPPQLQVVTGQPGPPVLGEPAGETRHVGGRDVVRGRHPDRLTARAHPVTAPAAESPAPRPARSATHPVRRSCSPVSFRAGGTPAAYAPCPPRTGFR